MPNTILATSDLSSAKTNTIIEINIPENCNKGVFNLRYGPGEGGLGRDSVNYSKIVDTIVTQDKVIDVETALSNTSRQTSIVDSYNRIKNKKMFEFFVSENMQQQTPFVNNVQKQKIQIGYPYELLKTTKIDPNKKSVLAAVVNTKKGA